MQVMTLPRTIVDFAGLWHIRREIADRHSGQTGLFAGRATLLPDAKGLVYSETGQLSLGDQPPMSATRRYLWQDLGHGAAIHFEDGRPFHVLPFNTAAPQARHDCPPDDYRVRYDFNAWPDWEAVWTVRGPRKDYTMTSRYARG